MGENCFTNDKWVVCEGLCKEQGRHVSKYMLDNFEEIKKGKENVLMVEFKALFMNEFHSSINDYNNSSPIIKVSKEQQKLMHDYLLSCYPNSTNLMAKVDKLHFPVDNLENLKA